jgi:hypothetical protein
METRGKLTRHKAPVEVGGRRLKLAVCMPCALENAEETIRSHVRIVETAHEQAEEGAKEEIATTLARFRPEVGDVYAGKAPGQNGRGNMEAAMETAYTLAAVARLQLTRLVLPGAEAVRDEVAPTLEGAESGMRAVFGVMSQNLVLARECFDEGWSLIVSKEDETKVDPERTKRLGGREKTTLWRLGRQATQGSGNAVEDMRQLGMGEVPAAVTARRAMDRVFGEGSTAIAGLVAAAEGTKDDEVEDAEAITEETLRRMNRGAIAELAARVFDLTLDASGPKPDLIAAFLEAQSKAAVPAKA